MRSDPKVSRSSKSRCGDWFGVRAALTIFLLAASWPAAADWLVTREGEQIRTRGPWRIEGQLVVFTLANGTLVSYPLAEVNLTASTALPAADKRKATTATTGPRKPVLVLTDDDVGHVSPEMAKARAKSAEEPSKEVGVKAGGKVEVTSWDEIFTPDKDGTEIVGTLENVGQEIASGVAVTVDLYDRNGELVATANGIPSRTVLPPSETSNFRAKFPSLVRFEDARFTVQSHSYRLVAPSPSGPATDEELSDTGE